MPSLHQITEMGPHLCVKCWHAERMQMRRGLRSKPVAGGGGAGEGGGVGGGIRDAAGVVASQLIKPRRGEMQKR